MIVDGRLVDETQMAREEREAKLRLCIPQDGQRFGKLVLDQWGQMVNEVPDDPSSARRKKTYFDVFRAPEDDPYKSASSAILEFVRSHEPPSAPQYLGTVDVTEEYIKSVMAPHN